MTRIAFTGSSRVLRASIIGVSMLWAGVSSACAASTPESAASQTSIAIEISLGIDGHVEASPDLVIPVTLSAEAVTGVKIVHVSNDETVPGTSTELKAGGDELDGSALGSGKFIVKTEADLKTSDDFTVNAPDFESPGQPPSPPDSPTAGGESNSEASTPGQKPSERQPAVDGDDKATEAPAAEDGQDKCYPKLAKELFDQDDGTYKMSDPKGGGKEAGNILSGVQKAYTRMSTSVPRTAPNSATPTIRRRLVAQPNASMSSHPSMRRILRLATSPSP